ncbi:hypothetical protein [Janthinobacterium sp.]|uniref:hypothetical protein n=1 Tax=Janthinobacterium sp. TaxID=1871054 RepID=UPI00293D32C9|nr:hypothetical protein [Janthinobacterium sp.]
MTMVVWETVSYRRKDPGDPGGAQDSQEKAGEGSNVQTGKLEFIPRKIRAEFVHSGRNGGYKASIEAKQLFIHFVRIDPDIVFKSKDDTSITLSKKDVFPAGENRFKALFQVTPHSTRNDGGGKVNVNFLIDTKNSLASFKGDTTFMNYLRDEKIWLTEHKYETNELTAIGYIVNKSPVLTYRPQLENDIRSALSDYLEDVIDDEEKFIPDMEISTRKIVHVLRDSENKRKGAMETQALEIKCESAHAGRLKTLLCKARLPEHRFGKFIPHAMAKNDPSIVKALIAEHNKFLTEIVAIPIFGLHENALFSLVSGSGEKGDEDDEPLITKMLKAEIAKQTADGRKFLEPIVLSIEQTLLSDERGKWFVIAKKKNAETVNRLIDEFLIPTAEGTIAFKNHENDSESFKQGIRRTNKPNEAMQSYAAILRENMTGNVIPDSDRTYDKHNQEKKRKQMVITYTNAEFPALPNSKKKQQQHQNQQTSKTAKTNHSNSGNTTTTKSASIGLQSDSSSNGDGSEYFEAYKNEIQAQLDFMKIQMNELLGIHKAALKKQAENEAKQENIFFANQQHYDT